MIERLRKTAEERRTILCFGIDPDIPRIQKAMDGSDSPEETIAPFFHPIIEKLLDENAVSAIKPNYAFFAQYGFDGLYVLQEVMQRYKGRVPIILDAKRGDIGKTGQAYARELYDFWGADAVTLSPYMGSDSVEPFLREGKLAYVLCRTSNKGGADFQELSSGSMKLYEHVARKAMGWKSGLVVGATSDAINGVMAITDGKAPMLIPGIGAQGGDIDMVMGAIKADPWIHRINASSSIAYAFEKGGSPADAALAEARKLNERMRSSL